MLMSSNKAGGNLVELPPVLLEHYYVIGYAVPDFNLKYFLNRPN